MRANDKRDDELQELLWAPVPDDFLELTHGQKKEYYRTLLSARSHLMHGHPLDRTDPFNLCVLIFNRLLDLCRFEDAAELLLGYECAGWEEASATFVPNWGLFSGRHERHDPALSLRTVLFFLPRHDEARKLFLSDKDKSKWPDRGGLWHRIAAERDEMTQLLEEVATPSELEGARPVRAHVILVQAHDDTRILLPMRPECVPFYRRLKLFPKSPVDLFSDRIDSCDGDTECLISDAGKAPPRLVAEHIVPLVPAGQAFAVPVPYRLVCFTYLRAVVLRVASLQPPPAALDLLDAAVELFTSEEKKFLPKGQGHQERDRKHDESGDQVSGSVDELRRALEKMQFLMSFYPETVLDIVFLLSEFDRTPVPDQLTPATVDWEGRFSFSTGRWRPLPLAGFAALDLIREIRQWPTKRLRITGKDYFCNLDFHGYLTYLLQQADSRFREIAGRGFKQLLLEKVEFRPLCFVSHRGFGPTFDLSEYCLSA
jgi:hypothetical protein